MIEDESADLRRPAQPPARTVSRAPAPSPRVEPGGWCSPKPKVETAHLKNLRHAVAQCEALISAGRSLSMFRGPRWDAEKKRWEIYRPRIDVGLRLCREAGLSDHKEFVELLPRIDVLDEEWTIACELRQAGAAKRLHSAIMFLNGESLNEAIRNAACAVIKRQADAGGKKLNIKEQKTETMALLRDRRIQSKTQAVGTCVDKILREPEFANQRNPPGHREK